MMLPTSQGIGRICRALQLRGISALLQSSRQNCSSSSRNNYCKDHWCCTHFAYRIILHQTSIPSFPSISHLSCVMARRFSSVDTTSNTNVTYKRVPSSVCIEASDKDTAQVIGESLLVYENFITMEEEASLFEEIEPYLKRLRYEKSHWDDAIHGYRETERKNWRSANQHIIQRVRDVAFPPGQPQLTYVHVLDLEKKGFIKAHIDSVRFCGSTIAGISLLSSSVMRLINEKEKTAFADILLKQRSLYIMKDASRYLYTHEILKEEDSKFRGKVIPRDRRISVICRNEADESFSQPNNTAPT